MKAAISFPEALPFIFRSLAFLCFLPLYSVPSRYKPNGIRLAHARTQGGLVGGGPHHCTFPSVSYALHYYSFTRWPMENLPGRMWWSDHQTAFCTNDFAEVVPPSAGPTVVFVWRVSLHVARAKRRVVSMTEDREETSEDYKKFNMTFNSTYMIAVLYWYTCMGIVFLFTRWCFVNACEICFFFEVNKYKYLHVTLEVIICRQMCLQSTISQKDKNNNLLWSF